MSAAKELSPTERSRSVLQALVLERQRLWREGADRATLEANRLSIEYWREHLARSLRQSRNTP
jgi:hypothetical protein